MNEINASEVAKQLGYPLPLTEFGVVRWESDHGFAFLTASGDGDGGLDIQVGQRVDERDEKLGELVIDPNGDAKGFWLGEGAVSPSVIMQHILSARGIMDSTVFIDQPEDLV